MITAGDSGPMRRNRITVHGAVQGVGFRPHVYRLASELRLAGFVRNDLGGVTIEVEGPHDRVDMFYCLLTRTRPPLSRIDVHLCEKIDPLGEASFSIRPSGRQGRRKVQIPPDVAICDDCLQELFDPSDRRYRYPFINCTNCGPRYTIVACSPYDRPNTTMRPFAMCASCEREYRDPGDRRFHAQPIACPDCGPRLFLHDGRRELTDAEPLAAAVDILRDGRILALRGLGGFHLAVDATNEFAVRELRRRKGRARRPLALMAPDLERVRSFCSVSPEEETLLKDYTCPIVLLRRKDDFSVASSVAYDNLYHGFMLPYTPLHHLILRGNFVALVMTSGNFSEEPIIAGNQEALKRLAGIADCFLLHDRDIRQRCDDSVLFCAGGRSRLVRRARGFVPHPIRLAHTTEIPILGCGGQLKNTIALFHGDEVCLSQHIGDLDSPAAMTFFEESVACLERSLDLEPEMIVHDLHPDYLSTRWALMQPRTPKLGVQHHHAHLVSVMAENRVTEPSIGIILDGTGYGTDGTIWGGEVLIGSTAGFERFAWLQPVPMPGATAAIKQPWRMALSYLHHAFGKHLADLELPLLEQLSSTDIRLVLDMITKRVNSPLTSSCGRLFDGISAIMGLCIENTYEAEAAVALEMAAAASTVSDSFHEMARVASGVSGGPVAFDWLIRDVVEGIGRRRSDTEISIRFHVGLAELFVEAAMIAREKTGIDRVALSGGVYQNRFFFEYILGRLRQEQFSTLTHEVVPTNDGGIALGQVVIGSAAAGSLGERAR